MVLNNMDSKIDKTLYFVTVHNNDGQMVDYECFRAPRYSEIIFPEVLKHSADFTLVSGELEIWMYDNTCTFDEELAIKFARYIKSKEMEE